jgi:hypothetical protein
MTKKDIIFLLVPSAFLAAMSGLSLYWASALLPDPRHAQTTEKNIHELAQKAETGEFGPQPDRLVGVLSDSWRARDVLHESLGGFHAKVSKVLGYGVLVGVALQIYVIFRVKAGMRRRDAS